MNLLLLDHALDRLTLPLADPRAVHLRSVLRKAPGDTLDIGVVNGPRGKATLLSITPAGLDLALAWGETPPPPFSIDLLLALGRPQTMRRLLEVGTTLGARRFLFFPAAKSAPGYASSSLWTTDEWRERLRTGAEQAFTTWLPRVDHYPSLPAALAARPDPATCLALDVYEGQASFQPAATAPDPLVLALGPEGGWAPAERAALRAAGFLLLHLGPRVLRTETALAAALALAAAHRQWSP